MWTSPQKNNSAKICDAMIGKNELKTFVWNSYIFINIWQWNGVDSCLSTQSAVWRDIVKNWFLLIQTSATTIYFQSKLQQVLAWKKVELIVLVGYTHVTPYLSESSEKQWPCPLWLGGCRCSCRCPRWWRSWCSAETQPCPRSRTRELWNIWKLCNEIVDISNIYITHLHRHQTLWIKDFFLTLSQYLFLFCNENVLLLKVHVSTSRGNGILVSVGNNGCCVVVWSMALLLFW